VPSKTISGNLETVFQNGYPGEDLGKSLNKKIFPNFLRYRRSSEIAVFMSCAAYAAYESAQGMKMEIEHIILLVCL